MKISIITVVYNSIATIRDTIESVLAQSYSEIEYIIIDGGSKDGTLEAINHYADRIHLVISEQDDGIYDAMNKGVAASSGDMVGFLNSDDFFVSPDAVQHIVSKVRSESLDVIYGDLVYVEQNNIEKIRRVWQSKKFDFDLLKCGWIPAHPTFYAKRELFGAGFDLKYRLAADYDLMLRILCQPGLSVGYLPETLVKMRTGGVTNRSLLNIAKQNMEILMAAKRCNVSLSLIAVITRKIFDRLAQRGRCCSRLLTTAKSTHDHSSADAT